MPSCLVAPGTLNDGPHTGDERISLGSDRSQLVPMDIASCSTPAIFFWGQFLFLRKRTHTGARTPSNSKTHCYPASPITLNNGAYAVVETRPRANNYRPWAWRKSHKLLFCDAGCSSRVNNQVSSKQSAAGQITSHLPGEVASYSRICSFFRSRGAIRAHSGLRVYDELSVAQYPVACSSRPLPAFPSI